MKKIISHLVYHAFLSAVLCLPAFYNGYPIAYCDIGAYLKVGLNLIPDGDRFLGYGLFLRFATLRFTLWTVIFLQGLIVNLLLFQVAKKVFRGRSPYLFHFLAIVILAAGSAAGWYVSTPMPDIFAAGVILSVYLIVAGRGSSASRLSLLLFLLLFFEISHFSHILLAFCLIAALAALSVLSTTGRSYLPRLLPAFLTTVFSVILLSSHNYLWGNGFVPSLSSNVFFVARLCDTPILKRYLEENVGREELSLVKFRNRLPDSYSAFLWNRESPFRLVYGWESPTEAFRRANPEYWLIVREIIFTPRYLFPLLRENARATVLQLARMRVRELTKIYTEEEPVYRAVDDYFPRESGRFLRSRQNRGLLRRPFITRINLIHVAALISAVAVIIARLICGGVGKALSILLWTVFLGVFFNAAVTSGLAMVTDRLQARVSWLVVFAGLICGWDWLINFRRGEMECSPGIKS